MRRVGKWWRLAGLVMLGAIGCSSTSAYNELRPNRAEEYKPLPEGLYAGEVSYPKEMLNQFERKEKDSTDSLPPPGQSGRMGSSMGGAMPH